MYICTFIVCLFVYTFIAKYCTFIAHYFAIWFVNLKARIQHLRQMVMQVIRSYRILKACKDSYHNSILQPLLFWKPFYDYSIILYRHVRNLLPFFILIFIKYKRDILCSCTGTHLKAFTIFKHQLITMRK